MGDGKWEPMIEELTMDIDGSRAYRIPLEDQSVNAGDSWDMATREVPDMEWTAEPDDLEEDDLSVSLVPGLFSDLVRRAATCCPTCDGSCPRVARAGRD